MSAYTEEEAKQKWCPAARVSFHVQAEPGLYPAAQGYIGNRDANDGTVPGSHCLGSACMWWRWSDSHDYEHLLGGIKAYVDKGATIAAIQFYRNELSGADIAEAKAFVDAVAGGKRPPLVRHTGYCGMAGRPE